MALDIQTLRHVARLARLKLSAEEEQTFLAQLSSVFAYFTKLEKIDTTSVQATHQVTALNNVFRSDKPQPSFPSSQALSTVTQTKVDYLVAPQTVKK